MDGVKPEKTGWRDQNLSQRHRIWGWDCPAVDIDFLMIEYDKGIPKAIVEYKNENADFPHPDHPSMKAIKNIADAAKIPFVVCRYQRDFSFFFVRSYNTYAEKALPFVWCCFDEIGWVKCLYSFREMDIPKHILDRLNGGNT